MTKSHQSGNVLFIILIAVALFAALSYAITSSSRDGAGNTDRENLKLIKAQIDNIAVALRGSVPRLMMNGCSIWIENADPTGMSIINNAWDPKDPGLANPACNPFNMSVGGKIPIAWNSATIGEIIINKDSMVVYGNYWDENKVWTVGAQGIYPMTFEIEIYSSQNMATYQNICSLYNTNANMPASLLTTDVLSLSTTDYKTFVRALMSGETLCYRYNMPDYVISIPLVNYNGKL
jgi:hypothetical protein